MILNHRDTGARRKYEYNEPHFGKFWTSSKYNDAISKIMLAQNRLI
jgi:hypothetical protein